ncbi:SAM hydrolase/SAM-dependent halogenase family protein [Fictibacillus gelatini]|uniref:SAM hydrolase/SAM-dependent halogenase family protein n=1 Tax=Fictibacillus gelatini TaxID=225985 RepID=UPI0003FC6ADD|nr:S-adenosyl-l-methionine hydroxide adenosyltransferase family protein [Fictibacillus gelatini]
MSQALVLQSDFGISDGAVSAMYGVAHLVNPDIRVFDLTHDIPPYNIWEGSYRLLQTMNYWPKGTVFVSVVDPGVGSSRRSIGVRTASGHFVITPDNGTLTHISHAIGIEEVRIIDETINRLPYSNESYTFHGRDIYAYTGARLASNVISFEEVGTGVPVSSIVALPLFEAFVKEDEITGAIDILDVRFGNLWTNIHRSLIEQLGINYGDKIEVVITNDAHKRKVYNNIMLFGRSFADTREGEPLVFINSLDNVGVAINQGSFARAYNIGTGTDWRLSIRKAPR